ncbi:hypothetical protein BaRGS_00033369, partial [Batillaria attramentaria]
KNAGGAICKCQSRPAKKQLLSESRYLCSRDPDGVPVNDRAIGVAGWPENTCS